MEIDKNEGKIACGVYELIGTAVITYSYFVTSAESFGGIDGVIITTTVLMFICSNVSGGHFNPAITLCMWLSSKELGKNSALMVIMLIGQFAGAMLGCFLTWLALCDYGYLNRVADFLPNIERGHTIPSSEIPVNAPLLPGGGFDLGTG